MIKRFKNTVSWTYVIDDLNGEDIVGTFYEKKLQERNEKDFRIKKSNQEKGEILFVQCKKYSNSFNSWIGKIYII